MCLDRNWKWGCSWEEGILGRKGVEDFIQKFLIMRDKVV